MTPSDRVAQAANKIALALQGWDERTKSRQHIESVALAAAANVLLPPCALLDEDGRTCNDPAAVGADHCAHHDGISCDAYQPPTPCAGCGNHGVD